MTGGVKSKCGTGHAGADDDDIPMFDTLTCEGMLDIDMCDIDMGTLDIGMCDVDTLDMGMCDVDIGMLVIAMWDVGILMLPNGALKLKGIIIMPAA